MWQELLNKMNEGDFKSLTRCMLLVENEVLGYKVFL